jgi:hypothetical protein
MLARTLILSVAAALTLGAVATPARADWDRGRWGWRGGGDWHHPWGGPCCFHPWVYAAPPPVYYPPPPPVYYAPPPGISFGFHWP